MYVCYNARRSPEISQKILFSAHLFLEFLRLFSYSIKLWMDFTKDLNEMSFLVETLFCTTCKMDVVHI